MSIPPANPPQSAILYQNSSQDIFLLDIPTSIALAQRLPLSSTITGSSSEVEKAPARPCPAATSTLLSTPALEAPYPAPPEAKTPAARSRVLERISSTQREFYNDLTGPVERALGDLKREHAGEWCLPRFVGTTQSERRSTRKRKKALHENGPGPCTATSEEPNLSPSASGTSRSTLKKEPFILAPSETCVPDLESIQDIVVKNPWPVLSKLYIIRSDAESEDVSDVRDDETSSSHARYWPTIIPPSSCFILTSIMTNTPKRDLPPILPLAPCQKFDFILMDPPWSNRSARRSSHYTHLSTTKLGPLLVNILITYLSNQNGIAGIWITNSEDARSTASKAMERAGLRPLEEWVWVKTSVKGEPVVPCQSLWRKPYEVLVLGCRDQHCGSGSVASKLWASRERKRRVIAAVPDVHSRKPNLKELVENIFFTSAPEAATSTGVGSVVGHQMKRCSVRQYSALEVFARNLTAGWWACGDEVLRFNWVGWWTGDCIEQDSPIKRKNRDHVCVS